MSSSFDTSAWMPVTTRPDVLMVRGAGDYLWDQQGKRYLDFVQGWAVNCLGHCPEIVQQALREQAATLINVSPAYHCLPTLDFSRELARCAQLEHAFVCSAGAEANEAAVKLARKWGQLHRSGAHEIITTTGSFHGRTLALMAASGKPGFAGLFPPAIAGFSHVEYGDVYAVERAIGRDTVAVMVEPIQGEAGVRVPPFGYLRELRRLTEARGLLLILDEIQTGMARTGKLFACEHEGVRPDIMTLGKGVGGSFPLAAMLARREVSCFTPGDQGGTYSGHPLGCAVGLAVLRVLSDPAFLEGVCRSGERLSRGLAELAKRHGAGEPRGAGLLWALPLAAANGPALVSAGLQAGLLLNAPQPNLLRFMPALNVGAAEIDAMLEQLNGLLSSS
jgi:acetylornithine/N-succinyldiaminopimelate aminotransferase